MNRLIILALLSICTFARAQQPIVWLDDCSIDSDCGPTMATLNKLEDRQAIHTLAVIADSANNFSAPIMHLMNTYYHHAIPVGANQTSSPSCSNSCNTSTWASTVVGNFAPGDTRTNYPACVTELQTVLTAYQGSSLHLIETGFPTCLVALMQASGGPSLIQAKVSQLDVLGGFWPATGSAEFNMAADPSDASYLAANWTSQNGYPPLYYLGSQAGTGTNAGFPSFALTTVNPGADILSVAGTPQRPIWDALSILHSVYGLSYQATTTFAVVGPGTVTVNATTGVNSWSTGVNSGQYYLTTSASATFLSNIFDGFSYPWGFCGTPVYVGTGAMSTANAHGGVGIK